MSTIHTFKDDKHYLENNKLTKISSTIKEEIEIEEFHIKTLATLELSLKDFEDNKKVQIYLILQYMGKTLLNNNKVDGKEKLVALYENKTVMNILGRNHNIIEIINNSWIPILVSLLLGYAGGIESIDAADMNYLISYSIDAWELTHNPFILLISSYIITNGLDLSRKPIWPNELIKILAIDDFLKTISEDYIKKLANAMTNTFNYDYTKEIHRIPKELKEKSMLNKICISIARLIEKIIIYEKDKFIYSIINIFRRLKSETINMVANSIKPEFLGLKDEKGKTLLQHINYLSYISLKDENYEGEK